MSLVSPAATTATAGGSIFAPRRTSGRYFPRHPSAEDLSVVSWASYASVSSLDLSEHRSHILPASPSSAALGAKSKMRETKSRTVGHREPKAYPRAESKSALLQKCYGNADLSDRVGRTLSVLLVARFALSYLLVTIDEE